MAIPNPQRTPHLQMAQFRIYTTNFALGLVVAGQLAKRKRLRPRGWATVKGQRIYYDVLSG